MSIIDIIAILAIGISLMEKASFQILFIFLTARSFERKVLYVKKFLSQVLIAQHL